MPSTISHAGRIDADVDAAVRFDLFFYGNTRRKARKRKETHLTMNNANITSKGEDEGKRAKTNSFFFLIYSGVNTFIIILTYLDH